MSNIQRLHDVLFGFGTAEDQRWAQECFSEFVTGRAKRLEEAFSITRRERRELAISGRDGYIRRAYQLMDPKGEVPWTKRGRLMANKIDDLETLCSRGEKPTKDHTEVFHLLWAARQVCAGPMPGAGQLTKILRDDE